jgi:hypothetical protein
VGIFKRKRRLANCQDLACQRPLHAVLRTGRRRAISGEWGNDGEQRTADGSRQTASRRTTVNDRF